MSVSSWKFPSVTTMTEKKAQQVSRGPTPGNWRRPGKAQVEKFLPACWEWQVTSQKLLQTQGASCDKQAFRRQISNPTSSAPVLCRRAESKPSTPIDRACTAHFLWWGQGAMGVGVQLGRFILSCTDWLGRGVGDAPQTTLAHKAELPVPRGPSGFSRYRVLLRSGNNTLPCGWAYIYPLLVNPNLEISWTYFVLHC